MNLPPIKYVQIMTHSRCNADCVFCPHVESEHNTNKGTMDDNLWRRLLDCLMPFADGINQGKVCPYLMNEPLIDRTIFAKIDDVYARFPQTCLEISTNGAALTEKIIDQLVERFVGRRHDLWLSHHGIDDTTLEQVMEIDHARATANAVNLLKKSNGRLNIRIRGLGESRDGRVKFFSRDQYLAYWNELARRHGLNMANVHVDWGTFHDRAGTLTRADCGANLLNMGTVRRIDRAHPFHCSRIDEWIHVMWDGRIRLCCMDYHGEVALPSLKEMTLVEYFQSQAYQRMVGMVSGNLESPPDFICKRCTSPGG